MPQRIAAMRQCGNAAMKKEMVFIFFTIVRSNVRAEKTTTQADDDAVRDAIS